MNINIPFLTIREGERNHRNPDVKNLFPTQKNFFCKRANL